MKTFFAMCQGDLIIIRDALREVIMKHNKVDLFAPETIDLTYNRYQEYIDEMVNHLNHTSNRVARIGELLDAINDALRQDDSE